MLEVRAIRPIEAGEELCISYTDLDLTTADRRSVLQVPPPSRLVSLVPQCFLTWFLAARTTLASPACASAAPTPQMPAIGYAELPPPHHCLFRCVV
jgi:hypothetical protein